MDLKVYPGKVTALVGDNGAGKSTLIKGLAGRPALRRGRGPVRRRAGHACTSRARPRALGIEVVYQDLALCDNLDIVQNMFLGREEHAHRHLRRGRRWSGRRPTTLRSLSVRTVKSVRQKVSSLSGGQRQTVAIARSVLKKATVVILDEPTAALGVAQTEQVLQLVRRLADAGVARHHHQPQPGRRLRGRRLHQRALPRARWSPSLDAKQTSRDDVVGYITGTKTGISSRGDGDCDERRRSRRHRRRRSHAETEPPLGARRGGAHRHGSRGHGRATRSAATSSACAAATWAACPRSAASSCSASCSRR